MKDLKRYEQNQSFRIEKQTDYSNYNNKQTDQKQ